MTALFVTGLVLLLCCAGTLAQTCNANLLLNQQMDTAMDLLTLYGITSTAACCAACSEFEECFSFTYTKDPSSSTYQQCVIKSEQAKPITGTNNAYDSGQVPSTYTRPTACGTFDQNTDYFLPNNIGSVAASSASDCCTKCSVTAGCNYWTLDSGTCWMKANMGNKTAGAGKTSGTVIPDSVLNNPFRTASKKGLGVYGTRSCSDMRLLGNVSWVYNWDNNPDILEECYDELGIEYIPMIWGRTSNFDTVYPRAKYLLTFNEPNFLDQSNMTPQEAAAFWPQIEAVAAKNNMKISSPSASYGGSKQSDAIAWMDQFFAACTNCKVDFITTHQYGNNAYDVYGAITNFKKYNKPIWVTEFGYFGDTVQDDVSFMNTIIPLFDNEPSIERYAWFGSRSAIVGTTLGNNDVFDKTKNALTQVGVIYANGPAPSISTSSSGSAATTSTPDTSSTPSQSTTSPSTPQTTVGSFPDQSKATSVAPTVLLVGALLYLFM